MNPSATSPTAVKLSLNLKKRLKRLASARKRTSHWLMREAIAEYVEREEKREAFKAEALASWHEYQETGKHITGDEVIAWLETWGDERELPAPKCHK